MPGTSFGIDDVSPGHSWPGLAILVCQGLVRSLALDLLQPPIAQSRKREWVTERPAFVCQRKWPLLVAAVVQLDLGLARVFS